MAKKAPNNARTVKIFVRIGALRRFDVLKTKTADLPVKVVWDRRRGERRQSGNTVESNQRTADRRQQLPFTWEAADFVVVEEEE
jgi:hypothetical protein